MSLHNSASLQTMSSESSSKSSIISRSVRMVKKRLSTMSLRSSGRSGRDSGSPSKTRSHQVDSFTSSSSNSLSPLEAMLPVLASPYPLWIPC
ncbi:hypothetical protein CONPUDRAFT_139893 [Coniophora puteana RWD-64-598 SS2]|uniref:Uncharacterized protein n=1 Tax=Coniophora puteana (strain RWD-64-598) TaxID=741705 RepID=A0A5M3MA12_CONPW|nr:uncharacterized protein CONPUDRAFT_139893 [Coniophora puteana RWD-64-598 SS2]EIW75963.1 hypothetical protein CONPUDRAFT_139893 [Coniophora puteana RWD-64-598 SS2]